MKHCGRNVNNEDCDEFRIEIINTGQLTESNEVRVMQHGRDTHTHTHTQTHTSSSMYNEKHLDIGKG